MTCLWPFLCLVRSMLLVVLITADTSDYLGTDKATIKYKITHTVDPNLYYYGHDDRPTDSSPIPQAMSWLALSEALHAPLFETDVAAFLTDTPEDLTDKEKK